MIFFALWTTASGRRSWALLDADSTTEADRSAVSEARADLEPGESLAEVVRVRVIGQASTSIRPEAHARSLLHEPAR